MAEAMALNAAGDGLADVQAGQLVQRVRTLGAKPGGASERTQDTKIEKSSKDFESILLSSWLQGAEKSFATVPGGDGEDDEDSDDGGKDQFQGIAMQALGGSLTASGGIGIAKMIAKHLRTTAQKEEAPGPLKIS